MRISDWSSDVCSSDLVGDGGTERHFDAATFGVEWQAGSRRIAKMTADLGGGRTLALAPAGPVFAMSGLGYTHPLWGHGLDHGRSEEHTSELQSLMRISYAVFCLNKTKNTRRINKSPHPS